MTSSKTKIVSAIIGFTMVLGAVAGVQTASAQAMSLSQLVDLFISLGIISADKAAAAKAAVGTSVSSTTYTRDLTIGSSGADVSALQAKLGVSPATGYFGSITKAAVMAYQAANGISSTGYVGPLTRAQLNAGSTVTTTTTTTTTGGSTTVVNTGIEGSVTANKSSVSNSTLREGDTMRQVLGVKLEAKLSNINVQRIKLDLGANSSVYTKVFKTFYLTDDSGAVLAQADLNSNTVVKNGLNYELTLGGFSYNVAKDATKYLWVKADLYSSIKTADQTSRTITLVANGVRGTDGAGIDQYAPTTAFSQSISLEGTLIDSAAMKLSLNANNVRSADVVASEGTDDDEIDGVSVLNFDLKAEKDAVTVTDLTVDIVYTGSGLATATKAYLYDGSTLLDSEDVRASAGATYVTFDDIDYVIAKDSTKTFTVKVDVRDANGTSRTITADVDAADVVSENSEGSTVTATGSAAGEGMIVRNVGAVFTLVGTPTITKSVQSSNDTSGVATSSLTAVFNVRIKAVGSSIVFGASGSTTPSFATTSTTYASIYRNGSSVGTPSAITSGGTSAIVSYSTPSSGVTTVDSQTWSLADGNTVEIPVTYQITIAGSSANQYAVQLDGIRWQGASANTSTFMSGKSEWRTGTVSLP
jgi:peptidoglycan hydrolase-like protein with peptidoglycan-binding domain